MVPRFISTYDLMQDKDVKQAFKDNDEEKIKQVLYTLGIDTSEPYELESVIHRPLTKKDNEPWFGPRYSGSERMDQEYLNSGYASWDAKVEACNDPSLRAELKNMSRQSSVEKAFTSKSAGQKAVNEERNKFKE